MSLPDFDAWAIFAKVAQTGSFTRASNDLGLSKPTVSKAIARLEARLGTSLFHRTSRRLALTESGEASLDKAALILAQGEAIEAEAYAGAEAAQGAVRMAAPMSFGLMHLAPALPAFFAQYPAVSIDLNLSDAHVDLVAGGYDLALRIALLADSTLRARRLCDVRLLVVGAPAYFDRVGRPGHPRDLARHTGFSYSLSASRLWRFRHPDAGEYAVEVPGPLRVNNGDAMIPSLVAGLGLAPLPEFMVWREIADGRLEEVLSEWSFGDIAVHLVTPPSPLRPKRVEVLIAFIVQLFDKAPWALAPTKPSAPLSNRRK